MPADGWKVANWAWERRDEVLKLLKQLRAWFRGDPKATTTDTPPPGILILGPGGTGKSTLARLLAGDIDFLLDPPGGYQASVNVKKYQLHGAPAVEVVVPPGQEHRRGGSWSSLLAEVTEGKYRGIVLVTAYGHQSIARDSYQQHPLYTGSGGKETFLPVLLEHQRQDELTILDHLLPVLRVIQFRAWVLTVVAKQDLWWADRDEVERHYREGEYQTRFSTAVGNPARTNIRHEVCSASLTIQNWITPAGERLKLNTEGYDHPLQVASIRRLIETFDSLRRWETGQ